MNNQLDRNEIALRILTALMTGDVMNPGQKVDTAFSVADTFIQRMGPEATEVTFTKRKKSSLPPLSKEWLSQQIVDMGVDIDNLRSPNHLVQYPYDVFIKISDRQMGDLVAAVERNFSVIAPEPCVGGNFSLNSLFAYLNGDQE